MADEFKDEGIFEPQEEVEEAPVIEEPVEEEDVPGEEEKMVFPFPLTPDMIFALTNGDFILVGKATLASGTKTVDDSRIKASSIAFVSYEGIAGTLGVALEGACTDGTLTITSYDSGGATETADTSDVAYIIILDARVA